MTAAPLCGASAGPWAGRRAGGRPAGRGRLAGRRARRLGVGGRAEGPRAYRRTAPAWRPACPQGDFHGVDPLRTSPSRLPRVNHFASRPEIDRSGVSKRRFSTQTSTTSPRNPKSADRTTAAPDDPQPPGDRPTRVPGRRAVRPGSRLRPPLLHEGAASSRRVAAVSPSDDAVDGGRGACAGTRRRGSPRRERAGTSRSHADRCHRAARHRRRRVCSTGSGDTSRLSRPGVADRQTCPSRVRRRIRGERSRETRGGRLRSRRRRDRRGRRGRRRGR
jgi:hypothetical protein